MAKLAKAVVVRGSCVGFNVDTPKFRDIYPIIKKPDIAGGMNLDIINNLVEQFRCA